jgi:glutamine amidotransferase
MIGIINYGMGNLGSVANALKYLDLEAVIIDNPSKLDIHHDHLILPGVGSFGNAMENLNATGWSEAIREQANKGIPLLGICLGMQLMFEVGEEHGITKGLGFLSGNVTLFNSSISHPVPHVGWNSLSYTNRHPLFRDVKEHVDFYFVHSYKCVTAQPEEVLAYCDYGGEFVAAAGKKNIVGVQFHPEKSQDIGLKILENFANWDGSC